VDAKRKVLLYDKTNNTAFYGADNRLRTHLSNDSLNTAFIPTNLYNTTAPLITGGYNYDDGLILGLSIKHTHQGFRKRPFASVQQLSVAHSLSTKAYNIKYKGAWLNALGKADLIIKANADAPNSMNFFGLGNETDYIKTGNYKKYYRARFSLYQFDPAVQWRSKKNTTFSIGPSLQYYTLKADDNKNRFINNTSLIQSYDSATIAQDKIHAGIAAQFTHDTRNNKVLPGWGALVNIKLQGYAGINSYSKSFAQLLPEVSLYKSADASSRIVFADRIGGAVTVGKAAFYQSPAIGGNGNLLGYRQFRFSGMHTLYNNFETRIKIANFASYILPGQFGLIGFYDVGRVWTKDDTSNKWHSGYGGGIYFSPAQMAVLQIVAGYFEEGWYPYISLGFRF
ncbi:MAG TPA: BamA/TamA family outer membrane protein, partial [Chitinophagaceae bacterium]|nr:BamA/TamA family outer membrane protein [Chitinophagaceae bacterium]